MHSFTQQVEEHGELVVECYGRLTDVMRGVILVETLCQIGLACGTSKLVRRVVFLTNGSIGFALPLLQYLDEGTKLVELIRYPQGHVARGLGAGSQAKPPIRGQAKAEALGLRKRFDMGAPGVSRPIGGQLDGEDCRAACVDSDSNGCVEGENLIAEIQHPRL